MFNWTNYPFIKYHNLKPLSQIYPDIVKNDWRKNYNIIHIEKTVLLCNSCNRNLNKYLIDLDDMIDTYAFRYHIMIEVDCPICTNYFC